MEFLFWNLENLNHFFFVENPMYKSKSYFFRLKFNKISKKRGKKIKFQTSVIDQDSHQNLPIRYQCCLVFSFSKIQFSLLRKLSKISSVVLRLTLWICKTFDWGCFPKTIWDPLWFAQYLLYVRNCTLSIVYLWDHYTMKKELMMSVEHVCQLLKHKRGHWIDRPLCMWSPTNVHARGFLDFWCGEGM